MTEHCTEMEGDLAMLAIGAIDGEELERVRHHVERCAGCAEAVLELSAAADALALLDGEPTAPRRVPPELAARVLTGLDRQVRGLRGRVAVGVVGSAAALAACLLLVTGALASGPALAPRRTVAMQGRGGLHAVALLTATEWGTSITLEEHGLSAGRYELSVRGTSGGWWTAGPSWAARGTSGTATLSCPVPMRDVRDLEVRATDGSVVLASGPASSARW